MGGDPLSTALPPGVRSAAMAGPSHRDERDEASAVLFVRAIESSFRALELAGALVAVLSVVQGGLIALHLFDKDMLIGTVVELLGAVPTSFAVLEY